VDGTTSYVYDNNDRLLSETKGSEVTSYVYDNNGNTESKTKGTEITLYDWDDQGRLVAVQNPNSDAVSYQYNENGIRVSSTINGVKTSFLLDANRDYAQVLEEYSSSGVQVGYVYGYDLISQNRNGVKSFYLYDGLGTTKALTDSSGVVTDRYIYDAYGNILSSVGTTQNSYLYTGEQFDKNLGQYYLRDRYYSQSVGRFTRSDSYQGNINDPLSLNKYLYTHGNPINGVDPSGQFLLELNTNMYVIGILSTLSAVTYLPGFTSSIFPGGQRTGLDNVIIYVGTVSSTYPFGHAFLQIDNAIYSYPADIENGAPTNVFLNTDHFIDKQLKLYSVIQRYSLSLNSTQKDKLIFNLNLNLEGKYRLPTQGGNYDIVATNCSNFIRDSLPDLGGIFNAFVKSPFYPYGMAWGLDSIDVISQGRLVKKLNPLYSF
jgi:RHS repeat-associated protein